MALLQVCKGGGVKKIFRSARVSILTNLFNNCIITLNWIEFYFGAEELLEQWTYGFIHTCMTGNTSWPTIANIGGRLRPNPREEAPSASRPQHLLTDPSTHSMILVWSLDASPPVHIKWLCRPIESYFFQSRSSSPGSPVSNCACWRTGGGWVAWPFPIEKYSRFTLWKYINFYIIYK